MARTPSPQLCLPYTVDDYIADRLDLTGFPLTTDPLGDVDLDV
jgi:hypothetical protein